MLPAEGNPAGYPVHGEDAVQRLAFIGAAKHLGLPLEEEVGELLSVWETGACKEVKTDLWPRSTAHLDEAQQRVAELTAFIASLHAALNNLNALPDRDQPCDPHSRFLPGPRFRASRRSNHPQPARYRAGNRAVADRPRHLLTHW